MNQIEYLEKYIACWSLVICAYVMGAAGILMIGLSDGLSYGVVLLGFSSILAVVPYAGLYEGRIHDAFVWLDPDFDPALETIDPEDLE
jgi:hypothetical protein